MNQNLYTRPNKPRRLVVTRRKDAPEMARPLPVEIVTLDASTECHITPDDNAAYMVDCLDLEKEHSVLEPHAGTGSLINALLNEGHPSEKITTIELNIKLCNMVAERFSDNFISPVQSCFLEYASAAGDVKFSRILMNPPFRQVKKHMKAALSLLADKNAVLVALVPITYQNEDAETCDILDNETFPLAKVNTKIIRIER